MIVFIFLGVAQLLNKNNGKPFTEGDENLFEVSCSVRAVIHPAENSGRRWGYEGVCIDELTIRQGKVALEQ